MRPMYQYGAADLRYGQSIQLGGSCPLDLSGSASYSIGFWLRPRAPVYNGLLLTAGPSYSLGLSGMKLSLTLPGLGSTRVSDIELLADQWQYVLFLFESTGANAGNYTASVNGTVLLQGSVSHVTTTGSPFVLGNTVDAQLFNVAFWSAALPEGERQPVWDVPPPGPTLAACYSFADGSTHDVSGHNRGDASFLGGAQVVMLAPSLRLIDSAVQPSPRDNLTAVADGGPFSVHAWYHANAPSPLQADVRTLFACKERDSNRGFTLGLRWGTTGFSLDVSAFTDTTSSSWGKTLNQPPGAWHHLAATYDGGTLRIYLDGTLNLTIPVVFNALQAPVWLFGAQPMSNIAGGAAYDFQGHLQAAGLWNRVLSDQEVQQYMSTDPSEVDGCVAYYAWNGDVLANQVTGNPPVLLNTARPSIVATPPSESTPPPFVNDSMSAPAPRAVAKPPAAQLQFSEPVAFPEQTLMSRDQAKAFLASLEPLLATVPESTRGTLRSQFRDNLHQGLARVAGPGGMPVGAFSGKVEAGRYVFYHHTAQGPVECGQMKLAVNTECIGWIVTVAATGFSMLLAAFGVGFAGARLISPIQKAVTESTALLAEVETVAKATVQDGSSIIRIIKAFYTAGTLGKIFGAVLTGSWFTIAANCAMLILQCAALWATGGAYVAVVVLQLVANFALFAYVLTQKPHNC